MCHRDIYRKRMNLKEVQSYSNGKSFILAAPVPRVRPVTIYERLIDEADGGKNAQHWSSSSLAVREAVSFHQNEINIYFFGFAAFFTDGRPA